MLIAQFSVYMKVLRQRSIGFTGFLGIWPGNNVPHRIPSIEPEGQIPDKRSFFRIQTKLFFTQRAELR
jgi:hypothetical protein